MSNQDIKAKISKVERLTVEVVADENICEEALAGNATVGTSTRGLLGVQSIQERGYHEVAGPNHRRRGDEDGLANPTNGESDQLCRHD